MLLLIYCLLLPSLFVRFRVRSLVSYIVLSTLSLCNRLSGLLYFNCEALSVLSEGDVG